MNIFETFASAEFIASLAIQLFVFSVLSWILIKFSGRSSPLYRSRITFCMLIGLGLLLVLSPVIRHFQGAFLKLKITREMTSVQEKETTNPENNAKDFDKAESMNTAISSSQPVSSEVTVVAVPQSSDLATEPELLSGSNLILVFNVLGVIWIAGSAIFLLKIILSLSFLKGFKTATAHFLDDKYHQILKEVAEEFWFEKTPNVFSSFAVVSPITVGVKNISVIVPENLLASMTDDEFRCVLYHEFAHIYHRDHIFGVIKEIVIALNWWNPLVNYIGSNHTLAREEISDNYAVKGLKSSQLYAESLVNLAEKVCLISKLPATAGMASKKFDLKKRINNILSKEGIMDESKTTGFAVGALLLVLLVFTAGTGFAFESEQIQDEAVTAEKKETEPILLAQVDTAVKTPAASAKEAVMEKTVVAVSPLSASGELAKEEQIISDIMQAELSVSENITLVDRNNLRKALKELQLAQQGMISPESAKKLGKIVGAKYFCSGKVIRTGENTMVIVKIIDVETTVTKLAYAKLKSKDDAIEAGKALAQNIEKLIANYTSENAALSKKIAQESKAKAIPNDWKRPVVMVIVPEMHVRQLILIDPAAETELTKRLLEDKFKVINSEYVTMMRKDPSNANTIFKSKKTAAEFARKKGVDILIYGEAISELGARLGEFEGCRARVEVKAIDVKNSEILISDSAYGGATDLAETTAGKKALQQAASKLADTFNYKLAKKWNKK